ncbi:NADH:ubiquinone oxidoreductase [Parasalinivibrio latis]|uniref:NADH-quinone oxidoreductase subunit B family protein n=1 Tax=Parasalinivibrio latis TaxID=2952610 RepID=UPI0030E1F66F
MDKQKTTMLWFQTGSCGGDTMALLSADRPSLPDLLDTYGIEMLWQPSLSVENSRPYDELLEEIIDGRQHLDILCVEGSIITAPDGTGMFDQLRRRAKKEWLLSLAEKARYVVAMGTCAAFGGVHAAPPNPSDCIGLQMDKEIPGGLLPVEWRSGAGYPVINIAGCPAHPNTMTKTLAMIAGGIILQLDHLNRPKEFFSTLVHQGCTRNEYHEYDVEESEFGTNGCMFFNLGCKGPFTQATCNTELWNGRSSKTRAGVPCFGCTSPGFPEDEGLFQTEKLGPIPVKLPVGVERANYMAYKNLAKAAAPERVKKRKMEP